MSSSEYFIRDLTTPKGLDYRNPEDVMKRVHHDLSVVIGSLANSGRFFEAADEQQVEAFTKQYPELHSRLLTGVVQNLEHIGISTNPDISPESQAQWLPPGYVRLSQPPTEPLALESIPA